jgi:hypothetical protein
MRRLLGVELERGWVRCEWDDEEVASVEDEEELEDKELLEEAVWIGGGIDNDFGLAEGDGGVLRRILCLCEEYGCGKGREWEWTQADIGICESRWE